MRRGAVLSNCRTYRYMLWRVWDEDAAIMNVIGLNPSTADETQDDPTIRRCVDFARQWGYGGLVMTNLFAYRATDPKVLATVADTVGPENDQHLRIQAYEAGMVVAAWGAHPLAVPRSETVRPLLERFHVMCLGMTKDGAPKHPLYLPKTTKPEALWAAPLATGPAPLLQGTAEQFPGFSAVPVAEDRKVRPWTA